MKLNNTFLGLVAAFLLLLSPVISFSQAVAVAKEDSPLTVNGFWNEDESSITRYIQVTSTQGGKLKYLAYDLALEGNPNRIISRGDISVDAISLTANEPTNVQVTFSNIPLEGSYKGKIQLYTGNGTKMDLQVTVNAKRYEPQRMGAIGTNDSLQINVVGGWGFNWLLPPSARAKKFSVTLENKGDNPAEIASYSFYAKGGKVGAELDNTYFVTDELPAIIPANGRKTIHFKIQREPIFGVKFLKKPKMIAPDSYSGNLQFLFTDGNEAEPVYVDLKMNSRSGLGFVILALLLGIILGKIIKDMSTKKAEAQVALMGELVGLKPKIEAIVATNSGDFGLNAEYKKLEDSINNVTGDDQADYAVQIEAFANRIATYSQLMDMMGKIDANPAYTDVEKTEHKATLKKLGGNMTIGNTTEDQMEEQVGMLLSTWKHTSTLHTIIKEADGDEGYIEAANTVLSDIKLLEGEILGGKSKEDIEGSLTEIQTKIKTDVLQETTRGTTRGVESKDVEIKDTDTKTVIPELVPTTKEPSRMMKGLQWVWKTLWFILIDAKEPDAKTRYWFFRPTLTFIILAWAVLAGINDAYLGNTTFGAAGFNDYLDLVLYGIGSKITASTIGDLGGKAAARVG